MFNVNDVIEFGNVSKTYPKTDFPAVTDLTFDVTPGEFLYIVGPSGSGKSTIVRIVLGELSPDPGAKAIVLGHNLNSLRSRGRSKLRQQLGVVFQDFKLLGDKNVRDNIAFSLHVLGFPKAKADLWVNDALETVGLVDKADRMPSEISGGEAQRVAIARAIVSKPKILLADEPTGNLDPVTGDSVIMALDKVNRAGTTVIMATHDQTLVDKYPHRVIELFDGKMVRDEPSGTYVG